MTREYKDLYGDEALLLHRKEPFQRREVLGLFSLPDSAVLCNFTLDWTTRRGVSLRALPHTEAQTGFRKSGASADADGRFGLTRDHLSFLIRGRIVRNPTVVQLIAMAVGDFATIRPPPSKADHFALH